METNLYNNLVKFEHWINMQILYKPSITPSLLKQFNNQQISISKDLLGQSVQLSFSDNIDSYESIKKANGELYKLIKNAVNIKRTKLLSMVAVSQGYENHHALKHTLETNFCQITYDMHPLKKLYILKKEIYKLFKMSEMTINGIELDYSSNKKELLFSPYIEQFDADNNNIEISPRLQIEINNLYKKYNIKLSKNKVVVPWNISSSDSNIALKIIKHFKAFFYPRYIVLDNDLEHAMGKKIMFSMKKIKSFENELTINDTMTDTPFDTIRTAFEYCYNSNDPQNIDALIEIITDRSMKSSTTKSKSSKIELLNYNNAIREKSLHTLGMGSVILKYMTEISLFEPSPDLIPFIKELESNNKINIGTYIKNTVSYFMQDREKNPKNIFSFDTVLKSTCLELTGKSIEDISDKSYFTEQALKEIVYDIERDIEFISNISSTSE